MFLLYMRKNYTNKYANKRRRNFSSSVELRVQNTVCKYDFFFFLRGLLLIKVGKLFSKLLLTGKIAFSCLDAQIESKAKSQWSELIIYRCKNTLLIA